MGSGFEGIEVDSFVVVGGGVGVGEPPLQPDKENAKNNMQRGFMAFSLFPVHFVSKLFKAKQPTLVERFATIAARLYSNSPILALPPLASEYLLR